MYKNEIFQKNFGHNYTFKLCAWLSQSGLLKDPGGKNDDEPIYHREEVGKILQRYRNQLPKNKQTKDTPDMSDTPTFIEKEHPGLSKLIGLQTGKLEPWLAHHGLLKDAGGGDDDAPIYDEYDVLKVLKKYGQDLKSIRKLAKASDETDYSYGYWHYHWYKSWYKHYYFRTWRRWWWPWWLYCHWYRSYYWKWRWAYWRQWIVPKYRFYVPYFKGWGIGWRRHFYRTYKYYKPGILHNRSGYYYYWDFSHPWGYRWWYDYGWAGQSCKIAYP